MPEAMTTAASGGSSACGVCNEIFRDQEKMVNSNGQLYHENCFV